MQIISDNLVPAEMSTRYYTIGYGYSVTPEDTRFRKLILAAPGRAQKATRVPFRRRLGNCPDSEKDSPKRKIVSVRCGRSAANRTSPRRVSRARKGIWINYQ